MTEIVRARSDAEWAAVGALFEEYAASLDFNLCFQGFAEELKNLPREYGSPRGCALLAFDDDRPVGCVALRPVEEETCEMKRLYVVPGSRARGIGRRLAREIIAEARRIGYRAMRLDTLASMTAARALYAALGFREISPYRFNPVPGAVYMELDLGPSRV